MPIYRLPKHKHWFPEASEWEPNEDVIAVGGDLHPGRLWLAYQKGIFPWNHPDEKLLWWHPRQRAVLRPHEVRVHKSSRNLLNRAIFQFSFNRCFDAVMEGCQQTHRPGQEGTWITDEHRRAFAELHHQGMAHSIEVWQDGHLVGGLYGMVVGNCFMGESMFSKVSNAGKLGFIVLCRRLEQYRFRLIDCQVPNPYLTSLGAYSISRSSFCRDLARCRLYFPSLEQVFR